jgi:hypothetical protein
MSNLSAQQFGMTTRFTDAGTVGNRTHITREDTGWLPIESVVNMPGARDEVPGEHRNKQGQDWDDFKSDIAARGIENPLFITVDHGQAPLLSWATATCPPRCATSATPSARGRWARRRTGRPRKAPATRVSRGLATLVARPYTGPQ